MNRDALRATAHNGALQPVRGTYGAIHVSSRSRLRSGIRPRGLLAALLLVSGGLAAYLFLPGALAPKPTLRIVSPESGATVVANTVTVVVDVQNAELSAQGLHLYYYLDAVVPLAAGESAVPTTGAGVSSLRTSHRWDVASPGLHILAVQLVTADDRPLKRPIVAAVAVYVPKAPASPAPTSAPPVPSYKDGGR